MILKNSKTNLNNLAKWMYKNKIRLKNFQIQLSSRK